MDSNLIYGKSPIDRIVSLEPDEGSVKVFRRLSDGSLESSFHPTKYWILADRQINKTWVRLNGDLHYKWGRQYDTLKEMKTAKFFLGKEGEDLYAVTDGKEEIMLNKGFTYYKNMKPDDVAVLSFDIETTGLDPNLTDAKVLLISNTFRDNKGNITKELFSYDDYHDEGEMIQAWTEFVSEKDPDCIIGHNIFSFDLFYLKSRAKVFGKELLLGRDDSPMKIEKYESKFRVDGSRDLHYNKCRIYGREIVDTMFLSSKFDIGRNFPSYGLKPIIKYLGLEKKDRQFYDASRIRHNYKNPIEWKKIKEYCIDDSDDALKLFDLMIPAQFYWTQMVPKSFQEVLCGATGAQINSLMVRSYLQNAHSIPKADNIRESFEGALSGGNPGIYKNSIKWDVASLYPSIILQYEIYNKEKDPQGNFLKMVDILTNERLKNKRLAKETGQQYYKDLEQSQKIGINSSYGFMGATGLNFNYLTGASEVTRYGREILQKSIRWATGRELDDA